MVSSGLGRTGVDRWVNSGNSSFPVLRRSAGGGLPMACKPLAPLDYGGPRAGSARLAAVELLVGDRILRRDADLRDRCGCTLSSPLATMRRTDLRLTCQRVARSCGVRSGRLRLHGYPPVQGNRARRQKQVGRWRMRHGPYAGPQPGECDQRSRRIWPAPHG